MAKKILIVDDEPHIVKALALRLKANNYDTVAAYDAMQAMKKAVEEKPDLIILDYKMPAGDGLTVFENLQRMCDLGIVPVIFITAFPDKIVKNKVMEMGAADFIMKPFDTEDLLNKVKKALGDE
ncbi:MAG: response regulator transcription factor [Candidatus Omnitrophica bacterium]|nr:response regulator transcription factor [Candidatus Omnitrophota bacterium]